eukprot:4231138-Amphidinium_carterae.1
MSSRSASVGLLNEPLLPRWSSDSMAETDSCSPIESVHARVRVVSNGFIGTCALAFLSIVATLYVSLICPEALVHPQPHPDLLPPGLHRALLGVHTLVDPLSRYGRPAAVSAPKIAPGVPAIEESPNEDTPACAQLTNLTAGAFGQRA